MSPVREIQYPLFLEASHYVTDDYWSSVLQELSYGNAPHGAYIDREFDSICFPKNGKRNQFFFGETTDAVQISIECVNFIRNVSGMCSYSEYIQRHENLRELYSTFKDWNSIKKKHVRELMLLNYVIGVKNELDLTTHQMKILMSNVQLWFQFKLLAKDDVEYSTEMCKITSINNVTIAQNGIVRLGSAV